MNQPLGHRTTRHAVRTGVASLFLAWIACGSRPPREPPECRSEAWVEAVARAECERDQLCWPDFEFYPNYEACFTAKVARILGTIEREGIWYGGDTGIGHGAYATYINCDYPLEVEESCPRPFPQWRSTDYLD